MDKKPPYVMAHGNLTKALDRLQDAATPPRFTQDFLSTKLNLSGGSAKPIIPFLKRIGLLASDGTPTDLYKRFRNEDERGKAAFEALRKGYSSLYEVNEYVHEVNDKKLKGIVVQVTGSEPDSSTVKGIVGSFKALKAFATFDSGDDGKADAPVDEGSGETRNFEQLRDSQMHGTRFGLSYTINLNLPATADVAVFDAIFKSLKEHLLK